jgi:hypothetical protein
MPTVERRPASQRTATISSGQKKDPKWRPLVSELEELTADNILALKPDDGDSMRALKVQVSRAANAANRKDDILYAENDAGELEVWLRDKPKQVRGPRKPRVAAGEE